ncbi:MAG: right-handed parallel beta-helix repeat-containing protein [Caldimonas sp.]
MISVLDPGGFGSVSINKSITIDGGGIEGSILASLSAGVTINAAATDQVVLRNLTIFGIGNGTIGVRVLNAAKVVLEHVDISGFNNGIENPGPTELTVVDSEIHGNRSYGILMVASSGRLTVEQSRILDNGSYGVRIEGTSIASVRRSVLSGNAVMGVSSNGGGFLSIDDCLVSNSQYGIGSGDRATVSVSNSSIVNTTVRALFDGGGPLLTYGNNRLSGNAVDGAFSGAVSLR